MAKVHPGVFSPEDGLLHLGDSRLSDGQHALLCAVAAFPYATAQDLTLATRAVGRHPSVTMTLVALGERGLVSQARGGWVATIEGAELAERGVAVLRNRSRAAGRTA